MEIILTDSKCPSCGSILIKIPDCGGDYYNTVAGYVLQSYCRNPDCPKNGLLRPMIQGQDPSFISNRKKIGIAKKIAIIEKKRFQDIIPLAKSLTTNNKDEFIIGFAKKIQYPILDIMKFSR